MTTPNAAVAGPQPQEHDAEGIVAALESLVGYKAGNGEDEAAVQAPTTLASADSSEHALSPASLSTKHNRSWWSRFFPSEDTVDRLFAEEHMGNYIIVRSSGQQVFEAMPSYVRIGMHLLFFHSKRTSLLRWTSVDSLLGELSQHQGKVYDDGSDPAAVLSHIESFVRSYAIPLDELAQPDLKSYRTFNDFFTRALKPGARPIAGQDDDRIITSAADCRLTVFSTVDAATKVWVKGHSFSLARLLDDAHVASASFPPGSSIAIFRLAPADYHRFHSPVGPSVSGPTKHITGEYYTVNPQAINQDFDVFTSNRRDVLQASWWPTAGSILDKPLPYAIVAVGAMLVGSIGWSDGAVQGGRVGRGDELGLFAYGGSTVIAVFPPEAKVQWDQDLRRNSEELGVETLVRVGERIGIAQV
ncbi:unnamed protein product [Parajaminaea phylloscopi]